jgi:serine/threonine protein kinase
MGSDAKPPPNRDSLGAAALLEVERLCNRFESAIRAGTPPDWNNVLEQAAPSIRPRLFRELLLIEAAYRPAESRPALGAALKARFPGYAVMVDGVLAELSAGEEATPPATGRPTTAPAAPPPHAGDDVSRPPNGAAEEMRVSQHVQDAFRAVDALRAADPLRAAGPFGGLGPIGATVGPYRIVEPLGAGGMGDVFKAFHPFMKRYVALKVIRAEHFGSPEAALRFRREIQAAAQLEHPNIIRAYDAGDAGGFFYLAMELAEGHDLARQLAREGPLSAERACDVIRQAALGLAHAHQCGLVHRDIKPANLFLTSAGVVKVLDLGLARSLTEEELRAGAPDGSSAAAALTRSGVVMGTPDFMAPEQAYDSRLADARSDVYSLGCTFYQLLTGRAPFASHADVYRKLQAHQRFPPDNPLGRLRPDLPAGLSVLVRTMMAKRPEHRFSTMQRVAEALATYAGGSDAPVLRSRPAPPPIREAPDALEADIWEPIAAAAPGPTPTPETVDFEPRPETVSGTGAPAATPRSRAVLGYSLAEEIKQAQALADAHTAANRTRRAAALEEVMRRHVEGGNFLDAYDTAAAITELQPGHAEAAELLRYLRPRLRRELAGRAVGHGAYVLSMAIFMGAAMTLPSLGAVWLAFWLLDSWNNVFVTIAGIGLKLAAGAWLFGLALTGFALAAHKRWLRSTGGTAAYLQEGLAVAGVFGGAAAMCWADWPLALALLGLGFAIILAAHFITPGGMPFNATDDVKPVADGLAR